MKCSKNIARQIFYPHWAPFVVENVVTVFDAKCMSSEKICCYRQMFLCVYSLHKKCVLVGKVN